MLSITIEISKIDITDNLQGTGSKIDIQSMTIPCHYVNVPNLERLKKTNCSLGEKWIQTIQAIKHFFFKKIKFNTDPPSNSPTLQFTCQDLSVFVRLKPNFTRIMFWTIKLSSKTKEEITHARKHTSLNIIFMVL